MFVSANKTFKLRRGRGDRNYFRSLEIIRIFILLTTKRSWERVELREVELREVPTKRVKLELDWITNRTNII